MYLEENVSLIESQTEFVSGMHPYCVYSNDFEYHFLQENWKEYETFLSTENYSELVKGLSFEDVRIISRTISRIKRILESDNRPLDLFDRDEMDQMYRMRHSFLCGHEVIKLSEGYAYNKYILPINHFEKGIFDDKHGITKLNYERFKHKCIIDAGAYIGDSACILSEYTDSEVYSFEPLTKNYEYLMKTIEMNNLKNVISINTALGKQKGIGKAFDLYENIASGACCTLRRKEDMGEGSEVMVDTLDSFVQEQKIKVGLIKVDVEGGEQDFIAGAKETIKNQRPSLIMSIYHNPDDFFYIKRILNNLVPEYKFQVFKPVDGCAVLDTVLLCEV